MSCDKDNLYKNVGLTYRDFRANVAWGDGSNPLVEPVPDTYYMRALYSQACHETGNFTSNIWKESKNAFGMRPSTTRHKYYCWTMTTQTGKYAGYDTHTDSVNDRMDLDVNFGRSTELRDLQDVRAYMDHVKLKGYATDPAYVQKWNAMYLQKFPNDDASYNNNGSVGTTDGDQWGDDTAHYDTPKERSKIWIYALVAAVAFFLYKKVNKK